MLKFRYYPIRFENKDREIFELEFEPGNSIQHYLDKAGIKPVFCDIIVEGITRPNDFIPEDGSDVIVTPKISPPVIAAIIAIGAYIAAHWVIATIVAVVIAYSIYAAVTAGSRQGSFGTSSFDIGSGIDDSSPTYGWDGIRSTQEVGVPVKIIYGRHRSGGNILNQFVTTDGDKQYLNVLLGLCEGEIDEISNVFINDNPVENFSGITEYKRYGTNSQSTVPNFEDLHNVYGISSELVKDDPYVYTTVDSDVEGFDIYLTLPGGLFQQGGSGGISSWDVTYRVEYKLHGDSAYTDLGTTTISGKSRTALRRVFSKRGLTAGQYDIRVTRTSDNSQLDPQKQGDLQLSSIDEIKTDDLIYPNTALYGIKALATEQLSGSTPNFTFLVRGKKVSIPQVLTEEEGDPVNWEDYYYDPDDNVFKLFSDDSELYWDGETFEDKWSANPIWCLRDLQLNTRYGMGEFIDSENLNFNQMLEMALICEQKVSDGEGGFEKKFRLDVVIDSSTKAPDILTQLSATFRAFAFYSQNGFSFRIDRPEDPVQVFGMGNIIKSGLQQSWKSRNEFYNMIEIQFLDQDSDYRQEQIAIMDEDSVDTGEPIRKKQIRLFTTKKSYAIREGRYALWISKYINRSISLRCGIDAIACQAGDRIDVSHDMPQWGASGRIITGSTTTLIKLDREVTLQEGKTYHILIRSSDDTFEERAITDQPGTYSEVNVSVAFTNAPEQFDVYSVGEVDKVVKPFRVIGIKREKDGEVNLSAIEYNESVYDESGIVIPTNNYSAFDGTIPDVTDLNITERLIKLGDGTIENVLDVWFQKPPIGAMGTYSKSKIYISDNAGASWTVRGETTGSHFAIQGDLVDLQTYRVAVVSSDYLNKENSISASPYQDHQVIGKTAPPSDVEGFIVIQFRDRLFFGWSAVPDVDLFAYEIRAGASWDAGYIIANDLQSTNLIRLDLQIGADQSFWIKARDTSGNYSTNATEAVITIDNIPFQNIISEYSEQPDWTGDKDGTEEVGGVLKLENYELTGTYETAEQDVGYVASFHIGIQAVVTVGGSTRTFDSDPDAAFDSSPTLRFSGDEVAGAATFEIRTSENGVDWTDYAPWNPGDYLCRYFQIRMTLTRPSLSVDLECSQLNYYSDLPDVDEFGEGEVTSAGDGIEITYVKEFHKTPSVNISILSGDGFIHHFEVEPDLTSFTVKLYDLSGVAQTGRFSYHIHGV